MEVWVVEYASGYCSDTFVELYKDQHKARERFLELVKVCYNERDDEPTLEEVLNYLENEGENISTDDTTVSFDDASVVWDGPEVYESLSYYIHEVL